MEEKEGKGGRDRKREREVAGEEGNLKIYYKFLPHQLLYFQNESLAHVGIGIIVMLLHIINVSNHGNLPANFLLTMRCHYHGHKSLMLHLCST